MSAMLDFVDNVLNRITLYRLMLYYLIWLLGVAIALSAVGLLSYDPFAVLLSVGILLAVCSITNWIFSKTFHVPANAESTYISALILALIISPLSSLNDVGFLVWAGIWAMASKYIVAIHHRHIFNPVAFAVALTYLMINQSASWWIGSAPLLPFVLLGGLLVVRKVQRGRLVTGFLVTSVLTILLAEILTGGDWITTLGRTAVYSPLFFFAFVILTEPLTTPATARLQILYGALVGFLFSPEIHLGAFSTTPEIAILVGNIFSYCVSPQKSLILKLVRKVPLTSDIYDFTFAPSQKFAFAPGQYMEWTLGHADPDSRGNRRYFTIASSPTENHLKLGVRFHQNASTFKRALLSLGPQDEIVATHIAGDFVLPSDPKQKCVFIAGGIGITPFRSMIRYLIDTRQPRPIVLFYVNRLAGDLVYLDVFERAKKELGLQTIYVLTDPRGVPALWRGKTGPLTAQIIQTEVPDYQDCSFYVSGPKGMVDTFT
ncbi:MAG: FAD-dependent oxidoreductase, partial [Acidobacteriota bacterium]